MASDAPAPELSSRAQRVFDCLQTHGALFFDELQHDAHLLRSELEDALGELVAVGLVNADSFAGLRALLTPASKRSRTARRTRGGAFIGGMADAGRWALVRKPAEAEETTGRSGFRLRRWSILPACCCAVTAWCSGDCWRARRTGCRPGASCCGSTTGWKRVARSAGEQFALPEALALLREVRKRPLAGELLAVSAVDPLNQLGTLLPGSKVPALPGNRILYRDGVPLAALVAGKPQWLLDLDEPAQREALRRLTSTGR